MTYRFASDSAGEVSIRGIHTPGRYYLTAMDTEGDYVIVELSESDLQQLRDAVDRLVGE